MKVFIGSDHGGFEMKSFLISNLKDFGIDFVDMGALNFVNEDDYPKYAFLLANAVSENLGDSLGILICRSSAGMCITANKVKGIRAATAWNEEIAKMIRYDDHVNVLCLASDFTDFELAAKLVLKFIQTPVSKEDRHIRRLNEVSEFENSK